MKPIAFALLVAQLAVTVSLLPDSPLAHPLEPTYLAALGAMGVTLVLAFTRFVAGPPWLDRVVLASFLAAMPVVYTWCAALRGDPSDLAMEWIGIVVFGGAALAGYRRWPWLIGAGIIAHGIGWDLWHHARSGYVPDWYSLGCLVSDLGVGGFALVHLADQGSVRSRASTTATSSRSSAVAAS
jgi:multisubunit Na+/H+ antiporter MnhF subunit